MGDRLVGCASYTMSEFHVRNYMARRPHINQEPNVGTSTVAIMCAELIECHTSGQTMEEYPVWTGNLHPVFLRLLLSFYNGEYVIASDMVCVDLACIMKVTGNPVISWCPATNF